MGDIGECGSLGAEATGQFDGRVDFGCFRHVGSVCRRS
jgi:hypothetical protein